MLECPEATVKASAVGEEKGRLHLFESCVLLQEKDFEVAYGCSTIATTDCYKSSICRNYSDETVISIFEIDTLMGPHEMINLSELLQ